MSVAAQRALRLIAQAVLGDFTGVPVLSPGDWETPSDNLPEIKLRCTGGRKSSQGRQQASFTTTIAMEVLARVKATSDADAQDALETLIALIEDCVLGLPELYAQLQQITSVDTETVVLADGRTHIGEARLTFQCETFEVFDPVAIYGSRYLALQQLVLNVDLKNVYDPGNSIPTPTTVDYRVSDGLTVVGPATGTYPNPPFPASVVPAPRVIGPDGRNEATMQINLS